MTPRTTLPAMAAPLKAMSADIPSTAISHAECPSFYNSSRPCETHKEDKVPLSWVQTSRSNSLTKTWLSSGIQSGRPLGLREPMSHTMVQV
jgi:hypothetical protein